MKFFSTAQNRAEKIHYSATYELNRRLFTQ